MATIFKTEGPTDLLALISLGLNEGESACCNVHGCKEDPAKIPWLSSIFEGQDVVVIHDADKDGQDGATQVGQRPGWAKHLAGFSASCRNVQLPYPIAPSKGKDLRDWISEGHTRADLDALIAATESLECGKREFTVIESDDDPHRLARVNLEQYAASRGGRTLRYWRDEWYVWKGSRYLKISEKELRSKITQFIRKEFERINLEAQAEYEEWRRSDKYDEDRDKGPPKIQKVTQQLVSGVLQATAGMVVISSDTELGTWLPTGERRNYISMKNGILDVDRLLANEDDCMLENSPDWFSMASLPYDFDPEAKCPQWDAFLEFCMEMDPERIKILQEWAGYLLLPDTGEQKFMVLEGEGMNGKSVYTAAITAMLGEENVSTVPLEVFGDRFSRTETLGKLLNAAGDCAELDKVAEGYIKSFTGGDRMYFDRKGVAGLNCRPTARLMLACNNRPRFSDRSQGIWRRMLLIPWEVQIPAEKRIKGMDKVEYWQDAGELPGIFNWAIVGLHRRRQQRGFTDSIKMAEAIVDYQEEVNPTRAFLVQNLERNRASKGVPTIDLYSVYRKWAAENGYHPVAERTFGKEVKRAFPFSEKKRGGSRDDRFFYYSEISFCVESICGQKVKNFELF